MGHYLILTGRTAQRDAELSTGGEGEVETWKGKEKDTQVLFNKKNPTKNGNKIRIVKGLLLIDYNMSSCAVVL